MEVERGGIKSQVDLCGMLVEEGGEYLGVIFVNVDVCVFDKETETIVRSGYDGVGYHKLVKGAEFIIMEGPHIVGEGVVEEVFKIDWR